MRIQEMIADEKPREKLKERGAETLSKSELLCLLLRSGNRINGVVEVSEKLLKMSEGSLCRLSQMSIQQLCRVEGVGTGKAASIVAAFELGRRCACEKAAYSEKRIIGPKEVYDIMIPHMKALSHEECWVFYLNRSQHIIAKEMMSVGGMSFTAIDTRLIIKKSLERDASAIILVHNHPSSTPYPSKADIQCTETLKKALKTMELELLDHIIICDGEYYSFSDQISHKVKL